MSGPISDDRQAILDALPAEAGTGYNHVPDRIHPPAAMALWAGLERATGDTFAGWTNSYDVWLVLDQGPNQIVTDRLDTLIWDTIRALAAEGFVIDGISEPFTYQVQGGAYLAVIVHANTGLTVN